MFTKNFSKKTRNIENERTPPQLRTYLASSWRATYETASHGAQPVTDS